ncbi:MAG: protein-L-isoaspartate O-methyltransferase family protein [Hyphomicrobiaceae bacterium]
MHVDYALQRKNMVESQVRPSDVTDRRIIRAMLEVPRELFLPDARKPVAYIDENLPLDARGRLSARWLMAPRTLAKLIQSLELGDRDVVLDIGGGSGYSAAVLGRIAQTVVAVESDEACLAAAGKALAAAGIDNVALVTGDLTRGFASEGPYDAILVGGAVSDVPAEILDQLKDGGRLACVVAGGDVGCATLWRRIGGRFDQRALFEVGLPMLAGFERQPSFVL